MDVSQGDVVIGPDFIGGNDKRPFIVVSNESHPFSDEECLVVLVTTTEREIAIELPEESFKSGGLPKESYASPWTLTTLKTDDLNKKIGVLKESVTEKISQQINHFTEVKKP